jgi:membrane protein YqaA with SNARE-associated domain
LLLIIALWAFAEAIVFFIAADVAVMALAVKSGTRKALTGAGVAALFAALGGMGLYSWASIAPNDVLELMVMLPGIDQALVEEVQIDWQVNGALGMFVASFSGVPYKLYAYAAGTVSDLQSSTMLIGFAIASILARLPRFIVVAVIAGEIGPRLIERFGKRRVWIGFVLGWGAFYAFYWSMMGF